MCSSRKFAIVFVTILISSSNLTAQGLKEVEVFDTPSWAYAVVLLDDIAYVADNDSGLRILDVSNPNNVEELSFFDTEYGKTYNVDIKDETAYLADEGWVRVIDLSDLEDPAELGSYSISAYGIVVRDEYAYVTGSNIGLRILDVSDPDEISEIGRCETQGITWGIHVIENKAFITDWDEGLVVVDITDPESPEKLASLELGSQARGISIVNDLAYIADGSDGLRIIDVSDLDDLHEVSNLELGGNAWDVQIVGDLLYMAYDGVRIIDISNPRYPREVGTFEVMWGGRGICVTDDNVYLADRSYGLRVFEFTPVMTTNQSNLDYSIVSVDSVEIGKLNIYNTGFKELLIRDISSSSEYFRCNLQDTIVVEPKDSAAIHIAFEPASEGEYKDTLAIFSNAYEDSIFTMNLYGQAIRGSRVQTKGQCISVSYNEGYMFVIDSGNSISQIDISDLERPQLVHSFQTNGNSLNVANYQNTAYVATGEDGLVIYQIDEQEELVRIGGLDTPGYAQHLCVSNDYVYVADGPQGLRIVDVFDPERPVEVGRLDTPGYARSVSVVDGYAFIADDASGLRIIDVQDPENPVEIGDFNTRGWSWDVFVDGELAYVADERYGLRIIDITDPENPDEVGSYITRGDALGITVEGLYAYIAMGSGGLSVVNVSDSEHPMQIDSFYTPYIAWDIVVLEHFGIVADSEGGLLLFDISNQTSISSNSNELPVSDFHLYSVVPSPFNLSTNISYSLPRPANVQLSMYNTIGQLQDVSFQGIQPAGYHSATWDAKDAPAGMYLFVLEAGDVKLVTKGVLLR